MAEATFYKNPISGANLTVTKKNLILKINYKVFDIFCKTGKNLRFDYNGVRDRKTNSWIIEKEYKEEIIEQFNLRPVYFNGGSIIEQKVEVVTKMTEQKVEPIIKEVEKVIQEKEDDNTEELDEGNDFEKIIRLLKYKIIIYNFIENENKYKENLKNHILKDLSINELHTKMINTFTACLLPIDIVFKNLHKEFMNKKSYVNNELRKFGLPIDIANNVDISKNIASKIIECLTEVKNRNIEINIKEFINSIIEEGVKNNENV